MTSDSYLPKVSVIIPSYNHSKFVKQAILSVVTQTYKNIELIVIDDGSKDDSRTIISELRSEFNFEYFEQENSGISASLNRGIRNSSGEYICYVASDDFYHEDKISKQVKFYLENPDFGFIHAGCIVVNEFGAEISRPEFSDVSWNIKRPFNILLETCFVSAPSVMIKRSVFEEVGYFDESVAIEDWDLWLRIAKQYEVGFQNDYLVYYRQHGSNTYFSKERRTVERMYQAESTILNKWRNEPHFKKIISRRKLIWFYRLSSVRSIYAFYYLAPSMRYFTNHLFYKGLLFLVLGNNVVRKLKK